MVDKASRVSGEEISRQKDYIEKIKEYTAALSLKKGSPVYYHVITFGCQQNESDSEILSGLAFEMGYAESDTPEGCDLILINTCAIREHAEKRALSITGQLKHIKAKNLELKIGICGCMVSQEHRKDEIKNKYPYVDFLFGTDMIYRLPEILYERIQGGRRAFHISETKNNLAEGLPVKRRYKYSSYVSVMYGCNNFCTYCIVPYVRGRERSRLPGSILDEIRELVADGCREITLLGQNVNSYGKDLSTNYDFADLLRDICKIEGFFWIKFMTSHPKDASHKLIDTIAENVKIAKQLHLPLQSGSDSILNRMNRVYDREWYLALIDYARAKIPDLSITSDIIVGFPGESESDFEQTLGILKTVRFDSIFSFIFSPRKGTPAAEFDDQIIPETKKERFERMIALQNDISKNKNDSFYGKTVKVLVNGRSKNDESMLAGRNEQNKIIHFQGDDSIIGNFVNVKITKCETFAMFGEIAL